MNLIKKAMQQAGHTLDDEGTSALEGYLDAVNLQHKTYETITNTLADAVDVNTTMESIQENGLLNAGTAILFHQRLEAMDIAPEIPQSALESVTNVIDIHQVGMEGLGHFINKVKTRYKEWKRNAALEVAMKSGQNVKIAEQLIGDLKSSLSSIEKLDFKQVTVKTRTDLLLLQVNGKVVSDPGVYIESFLKDSLVELPKEFEMLKKHMAEYTAAIHAIDLSSDETYKSGFLKSMAQLMRQWPTQLPEITKHFPDQVKFEKYQPFTNAIIDEALKRNLSVIIDTKAGRVTPIYDSAKKPADTLTFTKDELVKMSDAALQYLKFVADKTRVRAWSSLYDNILDILTEAYYLEMGEYSNQAKHDKRNLQEYVISHLTLQSMGSIAWVYFDYMTYTIFYTAIDMARMVSQLVRRAEVEVKG